MRHFSQIYILVCKIQTKQVAELNSTAIHLHLSISTTGQNFKVIALVNPEILRGGSSPPPKMLPLLKK